MSGTIPRTRQGLTVAAAAVAIGVAGDVLERTVPGRLDLALGVGALVLAVSYVLAREPDLDPPHPGFGLAAGVLVLSLIWRDSEVLFALNLLAIGAVGVLALPQVRALGLWKAGVMDYAAGVVRLGSGIVGGAPALVFSEIDWRTLPDDTPLRRLRGPALGLLAALPITAVFGGLLMNADPVFNRILSDQLALRLDTVAEHWLAMMRWGWVAAGVIGVIVWAKGALPTIPLPTPGRGRFGLGEVGTVLVVVDLLFASFVLVQFRVLFGGAAFVRAVSGLSYAEYARSGFFQLVAVAALSLPLLLAADWLLAADDRAGLRRFRGLALLMLLLLDVMLASALYRMRLYTVEYGLTELRYYTTAFMGWLVLVFGWFAATVLRGRRQRFAPGAVAAAGLMLVALNLLNPDALIARTNLARIAEGREVDAAYIARLSADALPAIGRTLPGLPDAERCALGTAVRERWSRAFASAPRWNIAFSRARRIGLEGWGAVPGPGCGLGAGG
ncbi:MAG TPA: DUF4173 domain-containing protein [Gemmatimonadales bacterium]|nr:DUF4173 domain-containing protein [Gemmatimonadales bacterium]